MAGVNAENGDGLGLVLAITDIVFASVVLSDGADIEKHLGEKTDEFINDYKDKGVNNET